MMDTALSIIMLAAIALLVGAVFLWRRGGSRQQVLLMALLAAIMLANLAIWIVPDDEGDAPLDQLAD